MSSFLTFFWETPHLVMEVENNFKKADFRKPLLCLRHYGLCYTPDQAGLNHFKM